MFELQVFSGGVNVAKGKPAKQSSTFKAFHASRAVDGNSNSFSHTNEKCGYSWWEIDLGASMTIESVTIMNRWCKNPSDPEGCLCHLSHAVLSIFDGKNFVAAADVGDTCGKLELEFDFSTASSTCTVWN